MKIVHVVFIGALLALFFSVASPRGVTFAQGEGCDGLNSYRDAIFSAGLTFVSDQQANDVGPMADLQSFTSAQWTAYAEINLNLQSELDQIQPPDWAAPWHNAYIVWYGLVGEVSNAAAEGGYAVVETFRSRLEVASLQLDEGIERATGSCPEFEELNGDWFSLTTLGQVAAAASPVAFVDSPGVVSYEYAAGQHDDNFDDWTESPPVGGIHTNVWQQCGFYDRPINSGQGVHTLEHGAVWITYDPALDPAQILLLKELAESQRYILVTPYVDLPSPIVATAWNKQLYLNAADDPALAQFIADYKNNPNYTPEYGATCDVGSTETLP